MKSLTPFDSNDYDAFAGVESETPMVCYCEHAAIILDGCRVMIVADDENEWTGEYPGPATAEAVANAIITEMEAAGSAPAFLADKFFLTLI